MTNKRPGIIAAACVGLGFIFLANSFVLALLLFYGEAGRTGLLYLLEMSSYAIVALICMIGLWMMKKWSIIIYTAFTIINQAIVIVTGHWNVSSLIIPGIIIAIGLSKYKLME